MRVSEVIDFDEYRCDSRFIRKKPKINGSLMHRFGDNIYWTGEDGTYRQLNSFHSQDDGSLSVANRKRDTGVTEKVLVGTEFAYFGKSAPLIPHPLRFVVKVGLGHKCRFADNERAALEAWLAWMPERGYVDEPGRW